MKTRVLNLGFTLLICMGISACNKEEFYEKEFLDTPTSGSTDGPVDGGGNGGTTGGSTTGSSGGTTDEVTEVFHQADEETKQLDVVWIIDNSGSMSDEQTALGINFSAFIDDFILKDIDFKMAITTTDTSSESKKGKMVAGSDVKLTSAMAQTDPIQFKADFKNLIKVGTSGSGFEKGLAASEGFMEKYSNSFVRPDAYLAVVVVSDEEDQSPKAVAEYTDYLKTFKASAGLVKVYSVVDVNNTNVGQGGISTGSERYKEASNRTAGLIANIRDDFYNVLTEMGESIINLLDSFALANAPVDGSLRVYVNSVETTSFTYDAATLSIKFNQGSLPPVGSEVKVTYVKQ